MDFAQLCTKRLTKLACMNRNTILKLHIYENHAQRERTVVKHAETNKFKNNSQKNVSSN